MNQQVYEVTANGRRWLVALTPAGRVLWVKRQVRARIGEPYFSRTWQSGRDGDSPSADSGSGAAAAEALKLQQA